MPELYVDVQEGPPDPPAAWDGLGPPSPAVPAPKPNRAFRRKAEREARRAARRAERAAFVARMRAGA